MGQLYDTHCHLDLPQFEEDLQEVLERANQANVHKVLIPAIQITSSRRAVDLAAQHHQVYAAVGVHPNEGNGWTQAKCKELEEIALSSRRVVAIGEIGLDFYRDRTPREIQQAAFRDQLELAAKLDLPVIIHSRQSIDAVLSLIEPWVQSIEAAHPGRDRCHGVFHAFEGSLEEGQRVIALGFKLGIGGPITYNSAESRREVVRSLPLESCVLETDAPFLAPHPHRGSRNEPAYVKITASYLANMIEIPFEEVTTITSSAADRLFHWSD